MRVGRVSNHPIRRESLHLNLHRLACLNLHRLDAPRSGTYLLRARYVPGVHNQISAGEQQGESMTNRVICCFRRLPSVIIRTPETLLPSALWLVEGVAIGPLLSLSPGNGDGATLPPWGGWLR